MPEDAQLGESSTPTAETPVTLTPVDQAVADGDFAQYQAAKRAALSATATPASAKPSQAESAPAQPADQAASPDASTPPAPSAGDKPEKGVKAKARNAELEAEIQALQARLRQRHELREELKALGVDAPTPGSSPDTGEAGRSQPDYVKLKTDPQAPKLEDFEDYADWQIAMSTFVSQRHLEAFEQRQAQQRAFAAYQDGLNGVVERGRKAHEDFDEVLSLAEAAGIQWPGHVTQTLLQHPKGHEMAYALAKVSVSDRQLLQRLSDPVQAGLVLGELLATASPSPTQAPHTPVVSQAPAPPTTLGARPQDQSDPVESAVASGDFGAYQRARLAQRMASRGR